MRRSRSTYVPEQNRESCATPTSQSLDPCHASSKHVKPITAAHPASRHTSLKCPSGTVWEHSIKLLEVSLSYQTFDVALPNVELAVLDQIDGAEQLRSISNDFCASGAYPYSVCISPASFRTRTSMNRSFGGSRLPVKSISVH